MKKVEHLLIILCFAFVVVICFELNILKPIDKIEESLSFEEQCELDCITQSRELGYYLQDVLAQESSFFSRNEEAFEEAVHMLTADFLVERPEGPLILWDRQSDTYVNGLADDIRIIDALMEGSKRYKEPAYRILADKLIQGIAKTQIKDGLYADFVDETASQQAYLLSLSGLTPDVFTYLPHTDQTLEILKRADQGSSSVFFPETYHLDLKRYQPAYDVYIEEQLLIALNRQKSGISSPRFAAWLKDEWRTNKKILNHYNRLTKKPVETEEKVLVYVYLKMYFQLIGEEKLADEVTAYVTQLVSKQGTESLSYVENILWMREK